MYFYNWITLRCSLKRYYTNFPRPCQVKSEDSVKNYLDVLDFLCNDVGDSMSTSEALGEGPLPPVHVTFRQLITKREPPVTIRNNK